MCSKINKPVFKLKSFPVRWGEIKEHFRRWRPVSQQRYELASIYRSGAQKASQRQVLFVPLSEAYLEGRQAGTIIPADMGRQHPLYSSCIPISTCPVGSSYSSHNEALDSTLQSASIQGKRRREQCATPDTNAREKSGGGSLVPKPCPNLQPHEL